MSDKEIKNIVADIKKNGKLISSDKEKSATFLKELGILDKSGNVSKAYKDVCIPIGQD